MSARALPWPDPRHWRDFRARRVGRAGHAGADRAHFQEQNKAGGGTLGFQDQGTHDTACQSESGLGRAGFLLRTTWADLAREHRAAPLADSGGSLSLRAEFALFRSLQVPAQVARMQQMSHN